MRRRRLPGRDGERGVSAVLFALFLTAILASAAFAVDLGSSRQISRKLQSVTDASSLAAAQELPLRLDGTDAAIARSVAADYTARNLHGQSATPTPRTCPPGSGKVAANTRCFTSGDSLIVIESPYPVPGQPLAARHFVYVGVCEDSPTYFAATIGLRAPRVCQSAVARRFQAALSYGRGLLTIDQEACPGLTIQGDSNVRIISDGGVFIDSMCDQSMTGNGNAWRLSAAIMSMAGQMQASCGVNICMPDLPPPLVGQPPIGDPLRELPDPTEPPAEAECSNDDNTITCTSGFYVTPSNKDEFNFSPSSSTDIVLEPGIHWFREGVDFANYNVRVEGPTSEVTGDGVLIYVETGMVDLSGNGLIHLDPPTEGEFQGISIFTSRTNASTSTITGTTGSTVGTVYMPAAKLEFGGTTRWDVTGMVVSAQTELFGNLELHIDPLEPAAAIPPEEDLGLEV